MAAAAHKTKKNGVLTSIENNSSDFARCTTPSIGYQWYSSSDPLKERQLKTEERRQQILQAIYSEEDYTVSVNEWLALQSERDRLLKLSFDQENEEVKKEFVQELRQMLYDVPQFSNSKQDQDVYQTVIDLKLQLADYAHMNNITSPPPPSQNSLRSKFIEEIDGNTGIQCASLPPPPPPPPPISLPIVPTMQPNIVTRSIIAADSGTNKKVGFLEELNGTNIKDSLRRVNIPRTPGGTPRRPKHRIPLDGNSHGDLIQRALLNKFHHLRAHSTPTTTASPGFADTSNSMEISSAWSEHYASDPDLTRINSTEGPPSSATSYGNDPSFSSPSTALSPTPCTPLTPNVLSPTTPSQFHRNLSQYSTSV